MDDFYDLFMNFMRLKIWMELTLNGRTEISHDIMIWVSKMMHVLWVLKFHERE